MQYLHWLSTAILLGIVASTEAQSPPTSHRGAFDSGGDPVAIAANEARTRQADKLRIDGELALRKREKAKAIALLLQSLKIDASTVQSRLTLADIYIKDNRSSDVIDILKPLVEPTDGVSSSLGLEVPTRMKYILALLDMRRWEEAVRLYEKSMDYGIEGRTGNLRWDIPGYSTGANGKGRYLSDVHFSPEIFDAPHLRTQAHLILGTRQPRGIYGNDALAYMLDQAQQALKSERHSLDAQFLCGILLGELGRFDEARKAFAVAAKNAPREAQPEIKAAILRCMQLEQAQKSLRASQSEQSVKVQRKTPS